MSPKYLNCSAYDSLWPNLIGYTKEQYFAVNELLDGFTTAILQLCVIAGMSSVTTNMRDHGKDQMIRKSIRAAFLVGAVS